MLHELVHMSLSGYNNWDTEYKKYDWEVSHHVDAPFGWNGSDYARDNEAFATYGASQAGTAIGLPVDSYLSAMQAGGMPAFEGAQQIYANHMELYSWDK
jgi:hypothetical protein